MSSADELSPRATHPDQESGVRRFSASAFAVVVAVVALAGSASSLLFTFLPELKPDPRDSVLAQLTVFAIDPNVTFADYLKQAYGGDRSAPRRLRPPRQQRQQLRTTGDVVYVRTLVDGFKHRHVTLRASVYNAKTQERYPAFPGHSPAVQAAHTVNLDTPSTSTIQLFFIIPLTGAPPSFVRVEMYDGTRMLAVADSPVIRDNKTALPAADGWSR
jgi:hypothetical protein